MHCTTCRSVRLRGHGTTCPVGRLWVHGTTRTSVRLSQCLLVRARHNLHKCTVVAVCDCMGTAQLAQLGDCECTAPLAQVYDGRSVCLWGYGTSCTSVRLSLCAIVRALHNLHKCTIVAACTCQGWPENDYSTVNNETIKQSCNRYNKFPEGHFSTRLT